MWSSDMERLRASIEANLRNLDEAAPVNHAVALDAYRDVIGAWRSLADTYRWLSRPPDIGATAEPSDLISSAIRDGYRRFLDDVRAVHGTDWGPSVVRLLYTDKGFARTSAYMGLSATVKRSLDGLSSSFALFNRDPSTGRCQYTQAVVLGGVTHAVDIDVAAGGGLGRASSRLAQLIRHRIRSGVRSADLDDLSRDIAVDAALLEEARAAKRTPESDDTRIHRDASSPAEIASNSLLNAGNIAFAMSFVADGDRSRPGMYALAVVTVAVGLMGALAASLKHHVGARETETYCGRRVSLRSVSAVVVFVAFVCSGLNMALIVLKDQR